jgi:hypothetical protein
MGGNNKEELEKFEPQKLIQTVKERIINTFAGLIPESEWEALVQKEVDAFFAIRKLLRQVVMAITVIKQKPHYHSNMNHRHFVIWYGSIVL